uniref:Uncharacterized protein n=1 Tax=Acrobeloides nanus TaxID=290746 RepID=A0A914E7U1_9BILA
MNSPEEILPTSPIQDEAWSPENNVQQPRRSVANPAPFIDADKLCKVCGDRAVGYNFGVICCESCKAFFRRNATREQEIICPFSNSCEINRVSRRFCQSCRLRKCLQVGMKRDWLLGEGSRSIKRAKINKEATNLDDLEKVINETVEDEVKLPKQMVRELFKKVHEIKVKPTECECTCKCGFYPPDIKLTAKFPQCATEKCTAACYPERPNVSQKVTEHPRGIQASHFPMSSAMSEAYAYTFPTAMYGTPSNLMLLSSAETSAMSSNSMPIDYTMSPTSLGFGRNLAALTQPQASHIPLSPQSVFNTAEECNRSYNEWTQLNSIPASLNSNDKSLLQELIKANGILKAPLELSLKNLDSNELGFNDVVRISDLAMRRIISMAKQLSMFMKLSQKDQIAILKGSLSELLILRGVMVFDSTKDIWNHDIYNGNNPIRINVEVLKLSPEEKHYVEHKKFLTSFDERWRKNENVMLILNGIVLFCPDRPNIVDISTTRYFQQQYYDLLRRYNTKFL